MSESHEEARKKLHETIVDVGKVLTVIGKDIEVVTKHLDSDDDSDFWLRTTIRTYFACLEARSFQYLRLVEACSDIGLFDLSSEELLALADVSYEVHNGKVVRRKAKISTPNKLLFTFEMMARLAGLESLAIDTSRAEWGRFKRCIEVRDRLTHPKTSAHLKVTLDELKIFRDTFAWIEKKFERAAADVYNVMLDDKFYVPGFIQNGGKLGGLGI